MVRIGRPTGLIRYDSARGLAGEKRRIWRPRLLLYAALGVAVAGGGVLALGSHASFEANLLRAPGMPFTLAGERVRNSFELHLVNKQDGEARLVVESIGGGDIQVTLPEPVVELGGGESTSVAVFAEVPAASFRAGTVVRLRISHQAAAAADAEVRTVEARMLGPAR